MKKFICGMIIVVAYAILIAELIVPWWNAEQLTAHIFIVAGSAAVLLVMARVVGWWTDD